MSVTGRSSLFLVERSERFWQSFHSLVRSHFKRSRRIDRTSSGLFFRRSTVSRHAFFGDVIFSWNQVCRLLRRLLCCDVALASPYSPNIELLAYLRCKYSDMESAVYLQSHGKEPQKELNIPSIIIMDGIFKPSFLRQDPLEAILVIFGRRALIFLFESSWKKMKNDTTFVRMRGGDHLGDAKMSKRAPRSVEFNFFNNCDRQKRFSQNKRGRADLQKVASDFLIFA